MKIAFLTGGLPSIYHDKSKVKASRKEHE